MGRYDGLVSYNGSTFNQLELKRTGKTHYSSVTSLLRDRQGHLWIGTYHGDLYQYDGETLQLVLENPAVVGDWKLSNLTEDNSSLD